jgi:hypothetical protein
MSQVRQFGPKLIVDCSIKGRKPPAEIALTQAEIGQRNADIDQALADQATREQEEQERQEAVDRLKLSTNPDTQDILRAMGIQ